MPSLGPRTKLGQTIPALPVRDARGAVAYYRERLGFEVLHHEGGFAVLRRDDAVLHLWEASDETWRGRDSLQRPVRSGAESFIAGTASCRVLVEGVDALYEELRSRDVLHPVSRDGVDETDFGTREFATLDPDGNLIAFFQRRRADRVLAEPLPRRRRLIWVKRLSRGLRTRLCVVVLMVPVGGMVAPESPVGAPAPPAVASIEAGSPGAPHDRGSSRCGRDPSIDASLADAPWERRLVRVAGRLPVGVAVGAGGSVVLELDAARRRIPASNQKLLLSLALFDHLGPDHRIPTRVAAREIEGGTVLGDLWLLGHGDPTLTAEAPGYWGDLRATTLAALARRIKASGVTRVAGRVIGSTGYFARDFGAPGWQPYVPDRYVQLPSSLVLNGNHVVGRSPERSAAAALTRRLERIGVGVSGAPGAGEPPARLTRVAAVRSRPLAELVAYMNHSSNNFFAEVLGKLLGAHVHGAPGTIAKGAGALEAWVRANGERALAHDSSGLSYRNRVSPLALVRLLAVASSKRWIARLRGGLPSAGEGTLGYRLHGVDVRAKTGSLFNGASALSGWVRSTSTGRWVGFSILGRDTPTAVEDRIVRILSGARIRVPPRSSCGSGTATPMGARFY